MKKRAMLLFFTSVLCMAFAAGCGRGKQDNADGSHQTAQDTQQGGEIDSTGTESAADSETTSQLQLGNAVEIPESFDGELAETEAHPQLEKAIAEYSGVSEEDYGNVRYYYNYVDLNGDGRNEILALVLGQDVTGIDGNMLLWLDEPEDVNVTSHSIRQVFRQVGAPIYISNHMTEGYRDLIITEKQAANGNGDRTKAVNAANAGRTVDGEETSLDETAGLDETTGENGAEMISIEQTYFLSVWKGDKYQELEEATAISSLDGYEGTAILTNNMESDIVTDNYHFLGEAMK